MNQIYYLDNSYFPLTCVKVVFYCLGWASDNNPIDDSYINNLLPNDPAIAM